MLGMNFPMPLFHQILYLVGINGTIVEIELLVEIVCNC